MKYALIPILILTLSLTAGCTYYDDDHAYNHQSENFVQNVRNNSGNRMNYVDMQNTPPSNRNPEHGGRIQVADDIATEIDEFEEVALANVLVYNQDAYIAVVLESRDSQVSKPLHSTISHLVKNEDRDIKNVYISANPEFVRTMAMLVNHISYQHNDNDVLADFQKAVQKEF